MTGSRHGTRIEDDMRQVLRRRTRFIGAALLTMLVAVLSVTCVAEAGMTDDEMACCARMMTCGTAMSREHDCCGTKSPRLDQQPGASRIEAPIPQPTLVALLTFALPTALHSTSTVVDGPDASPPTARGVPTYLLISTFRI